MNTIWENKKECPNNDLDTLLNENSDALCDENGEELIFHTGVNECKGNSNWNNIL